MILFKRNAKGNPIFWKVTNDTIEYGVIGGNSYTETVNLTPSQVKSKIDLKKKQGYKDLASLYDNAPVAITDPATLKRFLNNYLPTNNTGVNGFVLPMLCKTLNDCKVFENRTYMGEYKINGVRCIIRAIKNNDMFKPVKFYYTSREGNPIDMSHFDNILLAKLSTDLIDMMVEEGVELDGELYLPGYTINDINSFVKNKDMPQHYNLQYWIYDLRIESMPAYRRHKVLENHILSTSFINKEDHLRNKKEIILLPYQEVLTMDHAIILRNDFVKLGFEGIVLRDVNADYQFGGKRNMAMLKYKPIYDGFFTIVDIVPEGKKVTLAKLIIQNDINDNTFECTINANEAYREMVLAYKSEYIGKKAFVEYRERSGVNEVPFHAKAIYIK